MLRIAAFAEPVVRLVSNADETLQVGSDAFLPKTVARIDLVDRHGVSYHANIGLPFPSAKRILNVFFTAASFEAATNRPLGIDKPEWLTGPFTMKAKHWVYASWENTDELAAMGDSVLRDETVPNTWRNFHHAMGTTASWIGKMVTAQLRAHYVNEWTLRYAWSPSGIKPDTADRVMLALPHLQQSKLDGTSNVDAFIIGHNAPPSVLRKYYGKGLWKRIANNSTSRNQLICRCLERCYGARTRNTMSQERTDGVYSPEQVRRMLELPSTFLRDSELIEIVRHEPSGAAFKWLMKDGGITKALHMIFPPKSTPLVYERGAWNRGGARILRDTATMAATLGMPDWWKVVAKNPGALSAFHDDLVKMVNEKEAQNVSFPYAAHEFKEQVGEELLTFTRILDTHSLREEGARMHHCVYGAGYREECLKGSYMVYSVRREAEAPHDRVATVGVRTRPWSVSGVDVTTFSVDQVQGLCNCAPLLKVSIDPRLALQHAVEKEMRRLNT